MITNKQPIGSYFFANGMTVDQGKEAARALKAEYKAKGEFLSYNAALNMIAFDCMNMPWDAAIKIVQKKQDEIRYHVYKNKNPTENLSPEEEMAVYKEVADQYFLKDGKYILDDGKGSSVEMFPHNGQGLMVTQELAECLDRTLIEAGGVHQVVKDFVDFKIVFADKSNEKSLDHEFYFNNDGLLFFYLRRHKLERSGLPDFSAVHYCVCYPGESIRPIQTALHFTEFLQEFCGVKGEIVATESFDS